MSGIAALCAAMPPWTLVGGKGGVGKTTCAAAFALHAARAGERVLLLGTDPAAALAEVLGAPVGEAPAPVPGAPGLEAMQLDPAAEHALFLARWRGALLALVERGTYASSAEAAGLVDSIFPGADESMALLALLRLYRAARWERLVVDTAPTGHALRLLQLPASLEAAVAALGAMQDKHRAVVRALTTRPAEMDDTDRLLATLGSDAATLRATLGDRTRCAMILVCRAEEVVVAETARYARALRDIGVHAGAVVVNAVPTVLDASAREAVAALAAVAPDVPHHLVPLLEPARGRAALLAWGAAMRSEIAAAGHEPAPTAVSTQAPGSVSTLVPTTGSLSTPLDSAPAEPDGDGAGLLLSLAVRALTILGGKGGTGKSTAACALALLASDAGWRVRLVSTDPAPSLTDALGVEVGAEPAALPDVPLLTAQQLDARAEWERFRTRVAGEISLATTGTAGGAELAADARVLHALLDITPPGVDELYALEALGALLEHARVLTEARTAIIVDPAPTGHLLRLLELPETAVEWSHRIMRVLLAMRPLIPLGGTAEALLRFARRTRALSATLRDPDRAALVLVALDEPLVRSESEQLAALATALGVPVRAVLWNRAARPPAPLSRVVPSVQFEAPAMEPPPRGAAALRSWTARWSPLPPRQHA